MPELSPDEWKALADYIKAEKESRVNRRVNREREWKEVDRQIAMMPRKRTDEEGVPAWYPSVELPLQYNALEVIAADAIRLLFPRSGTWFKPSAEISDAYRNRWDANRLRKPIIGTEPIEMNLDQETADILVKQSIEHFHKLYSFRQSMNLFTAEILKYGTGIVRVREVRKPRIAHDYRGEQTADVKGPAVIPCSLWHTYLDDSWSALLHEGEMLAPSIIRWIGSQPLEDLRMAIEKGGAEAGYRKINVDTLVGKTGPDEKKHTIELVELEGDVIVPQNQRDIFLPNVLVTIAIGQNVDVIRFRENPMPFCSYVTGYYYQHDVRTAYGASPLVKGQPIQEIATESANDFLAASRLRTLPPVAYDRNDAKLTAMGGPKIYPQALWDTDNPDSIKAQEIGDPAAALNSTLAFIKQHEDTTGVNDARRGARLKSHTTAMAADIEASQGISRTDNFVSDLLTGPLPTILHMEYEIIKRSSLTKPQSVRIDAEGIDGWVTISSKDLADRVEFDCIGAEGVVQEQQALNQYVGASKFAIETAGAAAQLGTPVPLNFEEMIREGYERAGIQDTGKFVGPVAAVTGGAAAESVIPGIAGQPPLLNGGAEGAALPPPAGPLQ